MKGMRVHVHGFNDFLLFSTFLRRLMIDSVLIFCSVYLFMLFYMSDLTRLYCCKAVNSASFMRKF